MRGGAGGRWPPSLTELPYLADRLSASRTSHRGAFNDARRREDLRPEIEDTIRRFEPRFLSVRCIWWIRSEQLETTLRLRIEAVLHAEPAPEAVTFDTLVDPTTDDLRKCRKCAS